MVRHRVTVAGLAALLFFAGTGAAALLLASAASASEPEVGAPAPDFALQGSDGAAVSLSQFRGKQDLVLAWFPKAFTPG